MIEYGHLAHPGTQFDAKQSTYHCHAALGVWMVLDGIGGQGSGEHAACTARDVIAKSLRQGQDAETAIRAADAALFDGTRPAGNGNVRGTTALVLQRVGTGAQLQLTWLGSTQAFALVRADGSLQELTVDPSGSPVRSRTKALGVTQSAQLPVKHVTLAADDYSRILLCSESVSSAIDAARMREILAERDISAQEMVDTVVYETLDTEPEESLAVIALKL